MKRERKQTCKRQGKRPIVPVCLAVTVAATIAFYAVADARKSVRRTKSRTPSVARAAWTYYPLPERNWIRSGMWAFGSTENDQHYHNFRCPSLRKTRAQLLVGWESAQEALINGYEPCPICHVFDPRKDTSPGARVRRMLIQAKQLKDRADALLVKGDLPMASQTMTNAWIVFGDALMLAGDMEKKAGRNQNANRLYQEAANAYTNSQTALPSIPSFGAGIGEAVAAAVMGMAGGMGPGAPGGPPGRPGGPGMPR